MHRVTSEYSYERSILIYHNPIESSTQKYIFFNHIVVSSYCSQHSVVHRNIAAIFHCLLEVITGEFQAAFIAGRTGW